MTASSTIPPDPKPTDEVRLARAVPRFSHAVVDGGLLDDVVGRLNRLGLLGRSLFLSAGLEIEAAGPYLVALDQQPNAAELLLAEIAEQPAAVFWLCAAGDATLWHHLRTLNQVRLPLPGPAQAQPASTETVLFRHWDPRVLGVVASYLDEAQYARLLGPAEELIFLDPASAGGSGVARLARFPGLVEPPRGTLTFRADQVAAMDERMRERSHTRIASFLREHAAEQVGHLNDAGLRATVAAHAAEAQAMGVQGEQATGLWSCMRFTSRDDIGRQPLVWRFLGDPAQGATPEQRMVALFDLRTRALAKGG